MKHLWRNYGLSIVLFALFVVSMMGQTWSGWRVYKLKEQWEHGGASLASSDMSAPGTLARQRLRTGRASFSKCPFVCVRPRGSINSVPQNPSDQESPPPSTETLARPPVRATHPGPCGAAAGYWRSYEHSLSATFGLLFIISFALHGTRGVAEYNQQQIAHGQPAGDLAALHDQRAVLVRVLRELAKRVPLPGGDGDVVVVLRERGSPESKPVDAAVWETED